MSVNHSTIYVSYRDGSKPNGKKVIIGFSGLTGGMSRPAYTDRDGRALVEHSSTGRATVYVDGRDYGSFHAPGTFSVVLR